MNTEQNKPDWAALKGQIKARFTKLTDESLESLKGNLDNLSSKLQSVYGYAKEQADKEFASFKSSIHGGPTESAKVDDDEDDAQPMQKPGSGNKSTPSPKLRE